MWRKIAVRHGAMKETVKEVRKLKKKTPPRLCTGRCKVDRLLNTTMSNSGKIIIQYKDPVPMEHKNRYRYMVSRNAGATPDVEIMVHGGEKNRETFEELIMAMRRLRYHQRNNGSAAVEYRISITE